MANPSPARAATHPVANDWLLGLLLVLAIVIIYTPLWSAGFIWDDNSVVTVNPVIVGPLGLKEIWSTSAADICPLTLTTFWFEYKWWGLNALPYHLVNVLLHSASAVVLWRVLRSLQIPGAWLGAALWALHPVQVESVAWIAEMKNTQSGLFFVLSILFFLRWLKTKLPGTRTTRDWNYALTLLFAALAMLSKSSAVILPVILCLCAWWAEGRWLWRTMRKVVPVFLLSLADGLLSIWTQNSIHSEMPPDARTWLERLATAGDAVWFYLGKLIWPHPLVMVYPRWQNDPAQWFTFLPLVTVLLMAVILWCNRQTWARSSFFAFACFLVALFPVLGWANLKFFTYSYVADHFQYLASMAPLAFVAAGIVQATRVIPEKRWSQPLISIGLVSVLGLLSWQQASLYQSQAALWSYTVRYNPDCWVGYNYLGQALAQNGQLNEAIAADQKDAELNPHDALAFNNLGNAYLQMGKPGEAIKQYQSAIAIEPNDPMFHFNLGNAFDQSERSDEATAAYQKALELDSNYAPAQNGLGIELAKKGDIAGAIPHFTEALRLKPDFTQAQQNLTHAQTLLTQKPAPK